MLKGYSYLKKLAHSTSWYMDNQEELHDVRTKVIEPGAQRFRFTTLFHEDFDTKNIEHQRILLEVWEELLWLKERSMSNSWPPSVWPFRLWVLDNAQKMLEASDFTSKLWLGIVNHIRYGSKQTAKRSPAEGLECPMFIEAIRFLNQAATWSYALLKGVKRYFGGMALATLEFFSKMPAGHDAVDETLPLRYQGILFDHPLRHQIGSLT